MCKQQAHYLLCQQAQFSDGSVYFLMGILQYIEGQTKNLTKCHEKLVARVKTMVEEDGRIYIFWRKKIRGLGLHAQNLSSESVKMVTQGVSMKSWLVAWMHYFEKHSTDRECPKEESHLKLQTKSISEEGTVHDILHLKRNRVAKITWRGEELHWERESVLTEVNRF